MNGGRPAGGPAAQQQRLPVPLVRARIAVQCALCGASLPDRQQERAPKRQLRVFHLSVQSLSQARQAQQEVSGVGKVNAARAAAKGATDHRAPPSAGPPPAAALAGSPLRMSHRRSVPSRPTQKPSRRNSRYLRAYKGRRVAPGLAATTTAIQGPPAVGPAPTAPGRTHPARAAVRRPVRAPPQASVRAVRPSPPAPPPFAHPSPL